MGLPAKVLFVGAGPSQMPAIRHARSLGYEPYAVDADSGAVGFEYTVAFDVGDIRDPEFVKVCAQRYKVNAILAVATDVAVPSVARACASLGLLSIPVEAADISVNKLLQRKHMKAAGLVMPAFMQFHSADEALANLEHVGFPAVIKPSDAAGSRGVRLVQNSREVIEAAEESLAVSRSKVGLTEEYIEGEEISVEGFVVEGKFDAICISEKIRSSLPYLLDMSVHFPDSLSPAERVAVTNVASNAVAACGLDNCPVHIELLKSGKGYVVVEMAARGAGFRVFTNILPHVTGVDTIDTQLRMALGETVTIAVKQPLRGAVITFLSPIPGKLIGVDGLDQAREVPGVQEAEVYIEPGTVMGELKCGADRVGHLIAFGKDRREAEMCTTHALSLIKFKVE